MLTISSHAVMALITLWIGFLEWGSKRPPCVHTYSTRVGLQAPRYCTFQPPACCTYRRRRAAHCAYAVHVPASAAPFVPRTVAPQAPPRQLRGAQAVPRRLRRRPPAVLTRASRGLRTYVPGPPYGTHQCPGASGIRHRAAARGGHRCTSGYTSGSCRTYAYRVVHCRLNPNSNPNPDPDPQASCSSTRPSPSAATLCGPSPPPPSHRPYP